MFPTHFYRKKKHSENGLYESVFAYICRMYRYKHDKENIFVNLVKSALNKLPLGENFLL